MLNYKWVLLFLVYLIEINWAFTKYRLSKYKLNEQELPLFIDILEVELNKRVQLSLNEPLYDVICGISGNTSLEDWVNYTKADYYFYSLRVKQFHATKIIPEEWVYYLDIYLNVRYDYAPFRHGHNWVKIIPITVPNLFDNHNITFFIAGFERVGDNLDDDVLIHFTNGKVFKFIKIDKTSIISLFCESIKAGYPVESELMEKYCQEIDITKYEKRGKIYLVKDLLAGTLDL